MDKIPGLTLLLAAALLCAHLPARADEIAEEHALSMELETPHTDWAQPYALGATRVLFFSDGLGTNARPIIELMQRFDIKAEAAYWTQIVDSPELHWEGDQAGLDRIARFLKEPFDCYIFNGIPLTHLPPEYQYTLLQRVTEGAGLVLIGVDDERVLKPANRLADLPFLAGVGDAFRVKKGRAVRVPAATDTGYRVGWEVEYDYWQERLGRAVLWAAGKEPQVRLGINLPATVARSGLPRKISLSYERPRSGPLDLDVALRRSDGARIALGVIRVDSLTGAVDRDLPLLRAGDYHCDVRAIGHAGVEAWATAPFSVTSDLAIAQVALARDWGEVGEQLAGTAQLTHAPAQEAIVRVRLVDRLGRVLAQQDVKPAGEQAAFRFPIQAWMPMLLRVEATVLDGKNEVASGYSYFRVTQRHRGQFNFLVWDTPAGVLGPYGEEALARLGMTVQLRGGDPPLYTAAYDVAWVPYSTRILAPHDTNGIMQPVCWNQEPAVDEWVQGIVNAQQKAREQGVFVYSLGDETVTRGSCASAYCLEAYRKYLKQEYGDIGALNASWGGGYKSFDEVALTDPRDYDAAEDLARKNYPRWYDRQAFNCDNFVRLCKRFGDAYRRLDPQARTGFEGAGTFDAGDDYDLIIRANGFWSPYPGPGDEVIRSIAPRDFPRSNWMGYEKDPDSLLRWYWRMVTRGTDAVWWWRWENIGRYHGLLLPSLAPFPAVKELTQDTQVVRDGLGSLLLHCEMLDDGIAILYSMPSAYATRVEDGPSYGGYQAAHEAWYDAIRGCGLQFRYVTDRMLRQGEFKPDRFKVLVLPRAEAIGPREAAVIKDFVKRGGTVIADLRPGIYDGHCKPLQSGALDDLFGIKRQPPAKAITAAPVLGADVNGVPISLALTGLLCDPTVAGDGAAALAQAPAPVGLVHRYGEGRAILLNFSMASFPRLASPDSPAAARAFAASLFSAGGVTPAIRIEDAQRRPIRDLEVIRWRDGDTELLALFRETGERETARVTLPAARRIYDLRRRADLGRLQTFTTEIIPSRATFFALTPEPVTPPRIQLPAAAALGQAVAAKVTIPGASGTRAVRIRAETPDGTRAEWADQVVIVGPSGADFTLPIAYNDPLGTWTILATELFSNETTRSRVTVKEPGSIAPEVPYSVRVDH